MNYYIIGNGESRQFIDINTLCGYKVGCNGIYLHGKVDLLCAMDTFWKDKIVKESKIPLLSRNINNAFQNTLQLYDKGIWEDTKFPYRGYISGTTAIDYISNKASTSDKIFLLGFDFGYTGDFVNHIYKDTKFHPDSNRKAQNPLIGLNEFMQIAKRNPKLSYVWINDSDFDIKINNVVKIATWEI